MVISSNITNLEPNDPTVTDSKKKNIKRPARREESSQNLAASFYE